MYLTKADRTVLFPTVQPLSSILF